MSRRVLLALALLVAGVPGATGQEAPQSPPATEAPLPPLAKRPPGRSTDGPPVPRDSAAAVARPAPALARYADDPAFQYERVVTQRPSWMALVLQWIDRTFFSPIRAHTTPDARQVAYLVLALGLMAWVLVRLFRADSGGVFGKGHRGPGGPVLLDAEDIEAVDLDALLAAAAAEGRYRDAVRYLYLLGLQRLAARGAIAWRKDKTNRAYLAEVRAADPERLAPPFAEVTRLFEWVWYGEADVDAPAFAAVRARFDRLAAALDASSTPPARR